MVLRSSPALFRSQQAVLHLPDQLSHCEAVLYFCVISYVSELAWVGRWVVIGVTKARPRPWNDASGAVWPLSNVGLCVSGQPGLYITHTRSNGTIL